MVQESQILKHEFDRTEEFIPNPKLIELIDQLKSLLEPIQLQQNRRFTAPQYPVVLIVGNPRCGTTVLTQLLAASGDFSYPTNFLSRFAYAPQVGAMIQQMLFNPDYDYRGELVDIQPSLCFNSHLGKTSGALGISEFYHFWRKFFPNYDPGYLSDEQLAQVNITRMRSELAAIESVFDKPFMSKGKMMQHNIRFFAKQLPELFFIHIKRQTRFVLQSVMQSRRKFYGTDKIWWSIKPKEYDWLAKMDPIHQVAGQVFFTELAIDEQMADIDEDRQFVCQYEQLCANPHEIYDQLRAVFSRRGYRLSAYGLKQSFPSGNDIKIPEAELCQLEEAYQEICNRFDKKR